MRKMVLALLLLMLPMTSHAFFGKHLCLIKSPVRGLHASDITSHGFDVQWKINLPPEIPTDMRMYINGQYAKPGVPWWTLLLKPGVGASEWDHGIKPNQAYTVTVQQRSVCGKWSSANIVVRTPPAASEGTPTYTLQDGWNDAEEQIADFNKSYQWAEVPPCQADEPYGKCPDGELALSADPADPLNIMAGKYQDSKVESIVDDGVHTFIKTADGSQAAIYAADPISGDLTPVKTYYDPETGITVVEGDPRQYKIIVNQHQVVINPNSGEFGSGAN